ncbi:MAG: hypothetical protein IJR45_06940 [Firmicutes bacterium]|nr:hypothetical protein [Bacillota bacterium]
MAKGRKTNKKKNNKWLFILLAAVIIIAVAGICFLLNKSAQTMLGEKNSAQEVNYETSSKAAFHISGKDIFYCTKDGMQMIDKNGSRLWTDTFTMQQPVLLGSGDYAAVAEERGKIVRVYDTDGLVYIINAENPITTFSVNREGYTAVIMELPNEYITNIYNTLGSVVSVSSCPADDSIPVAVAVSTNSNIYATSYIDTSAVTFKSNVVMRYVSKSTGEAETIDGMFTAFSGGDGVVGKLDFYSPTGLVALSDKELIYVDIPADGSGCTEKMRVPIDDIMTAVDLDESGRTAIAVRKAGDGVKGRIFCYNKDGKETAAFDTADETNTVKAGDNIVLAASSSGVTAYDMSGAVLWRVMSSQETKQMFMYAQNELMTVSSNKMRIVKVKKGDTVNEGYSADEEGAPEIVSQTEEPVTEATTAAAAVTTQAPAEETVQQDDEDYDSDEDYDYSDDEDEDYDYDEDSDSDEDYDYEDEDYDSDSDEDEDYDYSEDEDYDYSEDEE